MSLAPFGGQRRAHSASRPQELLLVPQTPGGLYNVMTATLARVGSRRQRDPRPRPSFHAHELVRLGLEAQACRLTPTRYIRAALIAMWGGPAPVRVVHLPHRPALVPADAGPLLRGPKVVLSKPELARLAKDAADSGMPQARYMHAAVLGLWGEGKKPKKLPSRVNDATVHQLSALAFQLKKIGTNVNQIAKQANTALVPVSRAEVQYVLNQHQLAMSRLAAAVEKLLA